LKQLQAIAAEQDTANAEVAAADIFKEFAPVLPAAPTNPNTP
jgi:hypothetical protein